MLYWNCLRIFCSRMIENSNFFKITHSKSWVNFPVATKTPETKYWFCGSLKPNWRIVTKISWLIWEKSPKTPLKKPGWKSWQSLYNYLLCVQNKSKNFYQGNFPWNCLKYFPLFSYIFHEIFFSRFRLINKLGDPVRAVASKAIHLIGQLLEAHSAMTPIVLEEIEHLLYRPNVNAKAQYYGNFFLWKFSKFPCFIPFHEIFN